jgi:hypothetical protein
MEGLTGGYVIFGKTVKTGDYENEKSEVRLDFSDPNVLDAAGALAQAKTMELLGKTKRAPKVSEPAPADKTSVTGDDKVIRRGPGRPPKVETATPAADPAAIDVVTTVAPAEPADDLLTAAAEPVATITDADLVAALNRKVGQTKNAIAIKQVIGRYVTPPKSAKEIPQEKRAEFLAEIEKL